MLFVDDLPVVLVLQIISELALHLAQHCIYELIRDAFVHEHIVRRHAGLAAVEKLAEHDAPRRQFDLRVLVHDAGALAAQFQGAGR